uniref:Uncharacterized protein n=1 Tax=Trieres chinensis TaxID=1514140 RepID=A0A7S2A7X0_TRICV|mmetsp:Transcript_6512/g.13616  ORF Transcript_6512/g.13616 Transcript_6512/m.13616 type:complete len:128 (+) Transcript_6512:167-550(+)
MGKGHQMGTGQIKVKSKTMGTLTLTRNFQSSHISRRLSLQIDQPQWELMDCRACFDLGKATTFVAAWYPKSSHNGSISPGCVYEEGGPCFVCSVSMVCSYCTLGVDPSSAQHLLEAQLMHIIEWQRF